MGEAIPREDRASAGLLTMCLAVSFFTCIDTSAKWLILAGVPALQVVFARYAGHALLALALYLPQEGRGALRSNSPGKQVMRSAFLAGSTICNFTALQFLPITVTTTIMFSGPIVVTLLAIPILGERVGIRRIAAVCTGFLGVLIVIQPWGAEFHPAMLLSLAALTFASLYFIMTRMLAGVEANATQQLWSSGLAAAVLFPFVIPGWTWPDSPLTWMVFCGIGGFGAAGHICATIAHRWADASLLAPMVYIQVFLAAFASIVVFGEWPTVWTLAGAAVIIAAGLYIWQRERQQAGAA
ncbi:DMT family transporter [Roseivivax sediminis]|uniref:Permease of the drug/metabolite transporter (DMT) superfamily n=1 Tax=Roseivivax sediminis TaxID=936889 RepID=A0A1I1SMG2_9RHOB|nr:DMT family transporter [Roseivivax sediminis]SFD44210.1 Permease of the drug/metabolite transporter (DMT) superfamily [Roseivivax sediminis]